MTGVDALAAVAVGASAGGMRAVVKLLEALGRDFAPPLMLVQHRHRQSGRSLTERLSAESGFRAVEVADHHELELNTLHVAPADYHVLVTSRTRLALSIDAPVRHSRPSVDVLFESAADVFGASLAGVVLTGANEDGADGLAAIRAGGGRCYVEDPETAEMRAMPDAALAAVPDARALPIEDIGKELRSLAGGNA